jgi:hypothetical protein
MDMSPFPSNRHVASWAALCPGNTIAPASANRGRPERATTGCERALSKLPRGQSASRTVRSGLGIEGSCGIADKKAVVAVAHANAPAPLTHVLAEGMTVLWSGYRLRPSPRSAGHASRQPIARTPGLSGHDRTCCLSAEARLAGDFLSRCAASANRIISSPILARVSLSSRSRDRSAS